MPGTTTQGIPYPLSSENNNTPSAVQALAEFIDSRIWRPGDIRVTLDNGAVPTGWLAFGQTIASGQTLHAALWAVLPASYKSGSSIVLPDPTDAQLSAVLTNPGAVSGANSFALTLGQLPLHQHSVAQHFHDMTHGHTAVANTHTHYVSATTNMTGEHGHNFGAGATFPYMVLGGGVYGLGAGGNVAVTGSWQTTGTQGGLHSHWFGVTSDGDTHNHTINGHSGNTGTGGPTATGNVGSGDAVNVEGRKIQVRLLIKT
jgi:hypothetical protein